MSFDYMKTLKSISIICERCKGYLYTDDPDKRMQKVYSVFGKLPSECANYFSRENTRCPYKKK